ncbi:MAG: ISAs1 family transposase [Desulfamplus sp.]|nr:ISAs1 family transposase [Desulfamplus sp.]
MLCIVKKTVNVIVTSGNDYVIQVKENQPSLLNTIKTVVENNEPISICHHNDKSRGRNEQRSVVVFLPPVSGVEEWKGLQRIIHVKRQTTRNGRTSSKDSYYITSLNIDDAEQFATGIRGHWSIENRLHWVKDVIQYEDDAGIKKGNGIETLSLLKNAAINICREIGFDSIKAASIYFASNVKELLKKLL